VRRLRFVPSGVSMWLSTRAVVRGRHLGSDGNQASFTAIDIMPQIFGHIQSVRDGLEMKSMEEDRTSSREAGSTLRVR
jgi:hypothetical protein